MKKWKRVACAAALAAVLLFTWLHEFISIDSCLDHGGRWDYAAEACDGGDI